jgi:hypothetical protein
MRVGTRARFLPVKGEDDPGLFAEHGVDIFKSRPNLLEGQHFAESEVQVFRKTVIGKVASLQRRASLEGEDGLQVRFLERVQQPSETVVSFENVFANAHSTLGSETIGK